MASTSDRPPAPGAVDAAWLARSLDAARAQAPATLGLEELHGFLFAVACAPQVVQPDDWIPAIFDADGPLPGDEAQAARFREAVTALYAAIAQEVEAGAPRLPAGIELRRPAEANFDKDAPLMLWSRGFAQGHDWLEEAWDVDLPEEVDDDLGACLSALLFFLDPQFATALLEESGQPASELPVLAATLLDNFEGAMLGYAETGRMVREARAAL
jgi:uncharacterized protein